MKIVLPKTSCHLDFSYGPGFFLAGPVKGGDDWQYACCQEIRKHIANFYAVIPCPYPKDHPLQKFRMEGNDNLFDRQLNWERHYLDEIGRYGCILFWLPCESKIKPRGDGGPYASDTRGELGEWRGRLMHNRNLRVVIGAESAFPGLDVIHRNFNLATRAFFPIYETMEKTVAAAVARAKLNDW